MFFSDLKSQISYIQKPNEKINFTLAYFEQIQSYYHIIGMPYHYIINNNYNKKCFIYCLLITFHHFSSQDITVSDYFHLIETICPNFPKPYIIDISKLIDKTYLNNNTNNINNDIISSKYPFKQLSTAIYASIIYMDWIHIIKEFYHDEFNKTKNIYINLIKIQTKLKEFYDYLPLNIIQPNLNLQSELFNCIRNNSNNNNLIELSLQQLLNYFLLLPSLVDDIYYIRKSFQTKPISNIEV